MFGPSVLKAYLHNKLSSGLKKAGMTESERAALARSEDALTSSVMGRLAYLERDMLWRVLTHAGPLPRTGQPWLASAPDGEPDWSFWPSFDPHPEDGGERVEPDVLLAWGDILFVIEAKHHGAQDRDGFQWRRELRAVRRAPEFAGARLVLIGLGGTREELDRRRVQGVRAVLELQDVPVYRLDWRDLRTAIDDFVYDEGVPAGARRLLDDAAAALDRGRYFRTRGLGTLRDAVLAIGGLAGSFAGDLLARDPLRERDLASLRDVVGRVGSLAQAGSSHA